MKCVSTDGINNAIRTIFNLNIWRGLLNGTITRSIFAFAKLHLFRRKFSIEINKDTERVPVSSVTRPTKQKQTPLDATEKRWRSLEYYGRVIKVSEKRSKPAACRNLLKSQNLSTYSDVSECAGRVSLARGRKKSHEGHRDVSCENKTQLCC